MRAGALDRIRTMRTWWLAMTSVAAQTSADPPSGCRWYNRSRTQPRRGFEVEPVRRLLAPALLSALVVVANLLTTAGFYSSQAAGPNQVVLDDDLDTAGVQSSRTVTGNGGFSIGMVFTVVTTPYHAYQWELVFPTSGLAVDAVSENSAATGLSDCHPPSYEFDATQTSLKGGACSFTHPGPTTSYVGLATTIFMRCLADGTYQVQLPNWDFYVNQWGTTLLDSTGGALNTTAQGATVTCANVGEPATPTPTVGPPPPTPRPPGPNTFSLDAQPSAVGIQTSGAAFGSAPFDIDLVLSSLGSTPYFGYQWLLQLPTTGIDFVEAVEHTGDTRLTSCANPGPPSGYVMIYGGCGGQVSTTSFAGVTTSIELVCRSLGAFTIALTSFTTDPSFGTTLLDRYAEPLPTSVDNPITVTCAPPATPTATSTSSPTTTATSTSTATPPPISVGGVADTHLLKPESQFAAPQSRRHAVDDRLAFGGLATVASLTAAWLVRRKSIQ